MSIAKGEKIKIDQGFGRFTEGTIESFDDTKPNQLGHKGNYMIKITGGVDCFGKPAKIGQVTKVLKSHVIY